MGAQKPGGLRVTQDAFDERVQENMDEFDMGRAEALADVVKELTSQGVDLSNVDISGREDLALVRREAAQRVADLKALDEAAEPETASPILRALSASCAGDSELAAAARAAVSASGGVPAAARFLAAGTDRSVLLDTLYFLRRACRANEHNRDVLYLKMSRLPGILLESASDGDSAVSAACLAVIRNACVKTEVNKTAFMRNGGAVALLGALRAHKGDAEVVREACNALRAVTAADDSRKDFSGVYDHIKALVAGGVIAELLAAGKRYYDDREVATAVYSALRQVAANDDSVKQMSEQGGVDLVVSALRDFHADILICRAAASVMRSAAGNDRCRDALAAGPGLTTLLAVMSEHESDAQLQEQGVGVLAALVLRSPQNARRVAESLGFDAVLRAMRAFPAAGGLQRQGCLAIRNAAARCVELRQPLLDAGAEAALRAAGASRGSVDEAYAALRDLGCDVSLVTVKEDGSVAAAVQGFGELKANFDPSVERTSDVERRVAAAAVAPAHAGYRL